jgi:hypothetical protein
MNLRMRKRFLLFCTLFGLAAIGTIILAVTSSPGGGVDDTRVFELEANAADDASITFNGTPVDTPGVDWANVNVGGGGSLAHTFDTDKIDASDEIFQTGGAKDVQDVTQWKTTIGAPPSKDNIENAYAAAYTLPATLPSGNPNPNAGHLAIYFGADRVDNNGDSQMGFWFFQNNVSFDPSTGKFSGSHALHDLLIVAHFTIGGAVPEIEVFEWVGGKAGISQVVPTNTAGCNPVSGSSDKCAIVNGATVPSPWSFTDKSGSVNQFLQGEFLEGALDVTALFTSLGQSVPCISSFMAETRASAKPDSVLKDFVAPKAFSLCGISITKVCPTNAVNPAGTAFDYTFGGMVKNTGVGTLYVTVTDTFPTDATNISPPGSGSGNVRTYDLGAVGAGQCVAWPSGTTFDCSDPNPTLATGSFESGQNSAQNMASAAGSQTPGGPPVADVGPASVTCPAGPGVDIDVGKSCSTTVGSDLAVTVGFTGSVINRSPYKIDSLSGTDVQTFFNSFNTAPGGTVNFSSTTLAPCSNADPTTCDCINNPNTCATFSGSYIPSAASQGSGACDFAFTDRVTVTGTVPLLKNKTVTKDATALPCKLCPCGP